MNISNEPLYPDRGASFSTHRLRQTDIRTLSFCPNIMSTLFCGAFVFIGVAASVMFFMGAFATGDFRSLIGVPLGLCAVWVAFFVRRLLFMPREICLDRQRIVAVDRTYSLRPQAIILNFSDVMAIQILQKEISSEEHNYRSYELNLVCKDGSRVNLVDHGGGAQILEEAKTIARFLGAKIVVDADLKERLGGSNREIFLSS